MLLQAMPSSADKYVCVCLLKLYERKKSIQANNMKWTELFHSGMKKETCILLLKELNIKETHSVFKTFKTVETKICLWEVGWAGPSRGRDSREGQTEGARSRPRRLCRPSESGAGKVRGACPCGLMLGL